MDDRGKTAPIGRLSYLIAQFDLLDTEGDSEKVPLAAYSEKISESGVFFRSDVKGGNGDGSGHFQGTIHAEGNRHDFV